MTNKTREIYAVLEIKNCRISFMVGMYDESTIKVLYKKTLESSIAINGVIQNPIELGNDLKQLIKDVNNQLNISIKRISIAIPSDFLKIKNSFKTLTFNNVRPVDEIDIDQLINNVKKVPVADDEIEFFVRPYRYILDKKLFVQPPISKVGTQIKLKALVYTTKKEILEKISLLCKVARVEIMGFLPQPFSLAWNIASNQDLQRGVVIIDWDHDAVKAYVFLKEALCEQVIIPGGINKIINQLKQVMQCDNKQVKKYLFKMLNLSNKEKNNLIIYSKFNSAQNRQISLTHYDIRELVNKIILSDLNELNQKFFSHLEYNFPIILSGEILKISGFSNNLLYYNQNEEIMINLPQVIGARSPWCTGLLGNIFYQHLANKLAGTHIYSVNEISEYNREYLHQINLASQKKPNTNRPKLFFFTRMSKLKPLNNEMKTLNPNAKNAS